MNNKNSISQIEAALLDVRKAYRLLYTYQKRVLDIMKFIGNQTFRQYDGGWSKFSNSSPKSGKGTLDNWAWDWLNMYFYEFYFGDKIIDNNSIKFSVWLVSDTGFFDAETDKKLDLNDFSPVENSETKLIFVIGKNTWHYAFDDFKTNFKKGTTEYVNHNDNVVLLVKSFGLSAFLNGDETRKRLQEFVCFCHDNGISEISLLQ
jgi:hypothetical protein